MCDTWTFLGPGVDGDALSPNPQTFFSPCFDGKALMLQCVESIWNEQDLSAEVLAE